MLKFLLLKAEDGTNKILLKLASYSKPFDDILKSLKYSYCKTWPIPLT